MLEEVKEILATNLNVNIEEITLKTSLVDDLGADSLDFVELLMAFEDATGITIDDNDAVEFKTVQDIVTYLENAQG